MLPGRELPEGLKALHQFVLQICDMFAVWQVYIATPAYGGQVTVDYMTSVIHMVTQLKEATLPTHGRCGSQLCCACGGQVAWQLSLVAGQFRA